MAVLLLLAALAPLVGLIGWLWWSYRRFLAYHRHKGAALAPLGPWRFVRHLRREGLAIVRLGWWHVRARFRAGLVVPPGPRLGPPVLCVHGYSQDDTNLWGIRRALHHRGRPTRAVWLGLLGRRRLEDYVPRLLAAMHELADRFPDEPIDVVAHSMGGVVLRLALASDRSLGARVRRVVTLGTPHAGTAASRGFPVREIGLLGRRSPVWRTLPPFQVTAPDARIVTVAGAWDHVAYPRESCHVAGAENIDLPELGHAGLLADPEAIRTVVRVLCAP